jgi:transaldolase / glucose-6-phosphate isomerase
MSVLPTRVYVPADKDSALRINSGVLQTEVNITYADMDQNEIGKSLLEKNPTLWKKAPEKIKEISQCLGWLTLPDDFTYYLNDLTAFSLQIKTESYKAIVLLGMGGSSLCSEVARQTFGSSEGYPELFVLDNTAPSAIKDLENKIILDKTLFIVASKSGNTKETLSFFRYFYEELEKTGVSIPGNNFIAITDDETSLTQMSKNYSFRKIFINPSDLGGRYSVLSYFGLLPMVLIGIDISVFLQSAKDMKALCERLPAATNPGISLGVALGVYQKHGRDKITFILSSSIVSFGYWLEQLLAESTGKEGLGLIPINGELLGHPNVYDTDRVFVHMYLSSDENVADETKVNALEKFGHPIIRIKIEDKIDLGGEYYRWEIAVAIAGMIMNVNPFDQPNVEESKANTDELLEQWHKKDTFENLTPLLSIDSTAIYGGELAQGLMIDKQTSLGDFVNRFTGLATYGDYIAFLPYFVMTEHRTLLLQEWRKHLRDHSKNATTLLNGPRYLHSTGQLHKGGPNTGLYVIISTDEEEEIKIPGQKFGFGTFRMAQALGDCNSLDEKARRVIRIHLGKELDVELEKLFQSVMESNKNNALVI